MKPMPLHSPRREQGVVLMIALIVLVAMTLAALGMVRSIDTGTMVAGTIGFREAAVATADSGVEKARQWLVANAASNVLTTDSPGNGYYSTRQAGIDLTGNNPGGTAGGVDWGGSDPSQPTKAFDAGVLDATGAHVYYIIHRLCKSPGNVNDPNQSCATSINTGAGSTQKVADYSEYGLKGLLTPYYRITVRVNGPKNTVSYVQAVLTM
jgi:Tfp pilus assembly protein PilX